jgi:hypothetical protein
VTVSARDRLHFAAIAEAKRLEREERADEALAAPRIEGVLEGLALGAAAPSTPAIEAELDRRALGQGELQMRARRLGLR